MAQDTWEGKQVEVQQETVFPLKLDLKTFESLKYILNLVYLPRRTKILQDENFYHTNS